MIRAPQGRAACGRSCCNVTHTLLSNLEAVQSGARACGKRARGPALAHSRSAGDVNAAQCGVWPRRATVAGHRGAAPELHGTAGEGLPPPGQVECACTHLCVPPRPFLGVASPVLSPALARSTHSLCTAHGAVSLLLRPPGQFRAPGFASGGCAALGPLSPGTHRRSPPPLRPPGSSGPVPSLSHLVALLPCAYQPSHFPTFSFAVSLFYSLCFCLVICT